MPAPRLALHLFLPLVHGINVTIPASIVEKVSPCEIAPVFVLVEEPLGVFLVIMNSTSCPKVPVREKLLKACSHLSASQSFHLRLLPLAVNIPQLYSRKPESEKCTIDTGTFSPNTHSGHDQSPTTRGRDPSLVLGQERTIDEKMSGFGLLSQIP